MAVIKAVSSKAGIGQALEGAKLQILNKDGEVLEEWEKKRGEEL